MRSKFRQLCFGNSRIKIFRFGIQCSCYRLRIYALLSCIIDKTIYYLRCFSELVCICCIRTIANSQQMPAISEHTIIGPVGSPSTYRSNRHKINNKHNQNKYRQSQPTVGHNFINFIGNSKAFAVFFITAFNDRGNINIPFICNDTLCIIIQFFFGRFYIFLNMLQNGLIKF